MLTLSSGRAQVPRVAPCIPAKFQSRGWDYSWLCESAERAGAVFLFVVHTKHSQKAGHIFSGSTEPSFPCSSRALCLSLAAVFSLRFVAFFAQTKRVTFTYFHVHEPLASVRS